ncbi:MAG: hypothetical protein WC956_10925 [bacterium]
MGTPDVIITRNNGSTPACAMQMGLIAPRAEALLHSGISRGFAEFPIDRARLFSDIVSTFLTPQMLCTVLTTPSGATAANHNQLRDQYKGDSMTPAEALQRGVIARRLTLHTACPANYDWKNAPIYNNVDSCDDVTKELSDGIPVTMYTVPMEAHLLQQRLETLSAAPFYSRYSNSGPVVCRGVPGSVDTYHSLYVSPIWADLDFVMRIFQGAAWSAWQLRKSCVGGDNKTYSYDDLMFDFGMRAYIPIEVQDGAATKSWTLVIGAVAAASNHPLAGLIPSSLPYHRYVGGEYTKEVLAQAWANGWKVTR